MSFKEFHFTARKRWPKYKNKDFFNTSPGHNMDIYFPAPRPRQRKNSFICARYIGNAWMRHRSSVLLGIVSLLPLLPKLQPALGWVLPILVNSIVSSRASAPWPQLRGRCPAHSTRLNTLLGSPSVKTRTNLGQFQIHHLKSEVGILTYLYFISPQTLQVKSNITHLQVSRI